MEALKNQANHDSMNYGLFKKFFFQINDTRSIFEIFFNLLLFLKNISSYSTFSSAEHSNWLSPSQIWVQSLMLRYIIVRNIQIEINMVILYFCFLYSNTV